MTREEALEIWLPVIKMGVESMQECSEALDMAIKALEQESELWQALEMEKGAYNALVKDLQCSDCISRQAVLDLAKFDGRKNLGSIIHAFDVEQLPPVTPAEKVGQWIPLNDRLCLPEKDGEYLVTVRGTTNRYYITLCDFALNLYEVDKYDFDNRRGIAGFYKYNSEYGYYEVLNAVAWMPLPEPYKMCGGEQNE